MAFIPMLNTVEVVFNWTWGGQEVKNVLHFKFPSALTLDLMNELGTGIIDAILDLSLGFLSGSLTLDSLKLTDMTTVSAPTITTVTGTSSNLPVSGGATSASVPTNGALVTTYHTQNRGRSFRGRSYIPGLTPGDMTDPVSVTSGTVTSVLGLITAIVDAALTAGFTHVIASKFSGGAPRTSAVLTPVTSYSANADIDSQRRRLKGRGS